MLETVPIPDTGRADGRYWWHSGVVFSGFGESVQREVGGPHSNGFADAGNAAVAFAVAGSRRFDRNRYRQLHRDDFDGADIRQEEEL